MKEDKILPQTYLFFSKNVPKFSAIQLNEVFNLPTTCLATINSQRERRGTRKRLHSSFQKGLGRVVTTKSEVFFISKRNIEKRIQFFEKNTLTYIQTCIYLCMLESINTVEKSSDNFVSLWNLSRPSAPKLWHKMWGRVSREFGAVFESAKIPWPGQLHLVISFDLFWFIKWSI